MARDGQGYPRRRRDMMMMMKLCLEIDLVSYPARAEGLVNMIKIFSSLCFLDYYYYSSPCEFFTPALVIFHLGLSDSKFLRSPGLFLVFLSILVMLWSKCSRFFFRFPVLLVYVFFFQAAEDRSKHSNYNWYHRHPNIPHYCFYFSDENQVFIYNFPFLYFHSVVDRNGKRI